MKYMRFPTDIEVEARNPETGRYIKVPLHRIRATKDFNDVKAGDFGGLIQDESNLSQEGDCWIYDEAKVYDGAVIEGNAQIRNNAIVRDKSKVDGEAQVLDFAIIEGCSKVTDNAKVYNRSKVTNCSIIKGNAKVYEQAKVESSSIIDDNGAVLGSVIASNSVIKDNAFINKGGEIVCSVIKGNSVISAGYIYESKIDNDTIIQDSTCKVLITRGKVFVSKSSINVPSTPATDPAILENASVITSEIKSSTIKDSDICKSSVRYSKGIIDTTVQSSSFEYAFIKSGIIKKDSDCINYHNFGSSELNITFYRGRGQAICVSVNEDTMIDKRLLSHIKRKYSQRVLTEVTQLLKAIRIEGKCSEDNTLIYSIYTENLLQLTLNKRV